MTFWYGNGMMNPFGYALMMVSMVLFWGLIILAVIALVRYLGRTSGSRGSARAGGSLPEQVLAERFARGEIDEEEYRARLTVLRGGSSASGP